jgi:predicted MPP superfamily phosphohydrolase
VNSSFISGLDLSGDVVLERVKIKLPNLPSQFRGMTIGMICDIHSSIFMPRERMERYAKAVQSLNADLIVVPGDFVNSKLTEVYPMAEAFSGLTAPMGVYGVTGNHDYYTRRIEQVVKEVEQAGISVIRNDHVLIEKDGAKLALLGVDDVSVGDVNEFVKHGKTEQGTIEGLEKGMQEGRSSILLAHKPYSFEGYARFGVDLVLSGHTHGGQIVLSARDRPAVSVAALASTYVAGLYKSKTVPGSQMYISRGVGTVGIPIRLNCPPEITHFMLV